MENNFSPEHFFNLDGFPHREIFSGCRVVWEAVPKIENYILDLFKKGKLHANCGENIYLGEGTVVEPGAYIKGPAIIGRNSRISHVAYVRENVLAGDNCVFGHSVEVKNTIFLPGAAVAHLSYIGESILGRDVNIAGGTILANFRLDQKPVRVHRGENIHETNLLKFGSVVGDGGRIGVNSVLNPGTLLGKNCQVYPLTSVRGYHPAESVIR